MFLKKMYLATFFRAQGRENGDIGEVSRDVDDNKGA